MNIHQRTKTGWWIKKSKIHHQDYVRINYEIISRSYIGGYCYYDHSSINIINSWWVSEKNEHT